MNADNVVYMNGEFVPESDARISVFDRGFLYGDGVFETMRSYAGKIFRLSKHIDRLLRSAIIISIKPSQSHDQLSEICTQLLERNGLSDAILRISLTRGPAAGGIGISRTGSPTIVAFARPPTPLPPNAYTHGVSAKIVTIQRTASSSMDSRIKSMNFLNYILARLEAEQAGAFEAIMLDASGHIAEASTSNLFFAKGTTLVTPSLDCDILPGITRATVLELAREVGFDWEERRINPQEIAEFSECFLTNSGLELVPVTLIDNTQVGEGGPGPVYERLRISYRELTQKG
jgi:branched-chain amino acid aminotransferase